MSPPGRIGVLLMAHGTPSGPNEVEAFYTHIRRGRPPTTAELEELQARYAAIGGVSPLTERTHAQAACLSAALDQLARSDDQFAYVVSLGNKHVEPMLETAVEELVAAGVDEIIGLVLAPHFARRSVGEYHERAVAAAAGRVRLCTIASWHDEPDLIELLAARVRAVAEPDALLIVTAHSLPLPALTDDDPYIAQVARTAELLAAAAEVPRHRVAWQSGGRGAVAWLEPDVRDVIVEEAARGTHAIVVCAAGFTAEHLEVAYDLDIEAAAVAAQHDVGFARTKSLDDDPAFCSLLADLVVRAARGERSPRMVS